MAKGCHILHAKKKREMRGESEVPSFLQGSLPIAKGASTRSHFPKVIFPPISVSLWPKSFTGDSWAHSLVQTMAENVLDSQNCGDNLLQRRRLKTVGHFFFQNSGRQKHEVEILPISSKGNGNFISCLRLLLMVGGGQYSVPMVTYSQSLWFSSHDLLSFHVTMFFSSYQDVVISFGETIDISG